MSVPLTGQTERLAFVAELAMMLYISKRIADRDYTPNSLFCGVNARIDALCELLNLHDETMRNK